MTRHGRRTYDILDIERVTAARGRLEFKMLQVLSAGDEIKRYEIKIRRLILLNIRK